ncbi:MAG: diguanylate cyclase response regulator [Paracoccus sp.]|uniref:diguanylate cyclase n=1 Tax=Paracoccus sp. TaxID=267 RepID=UPI000C46DE0C|nr:diguanylate cyclase [Paracoccus sp. (in: a-proteobacteria)]MBA50262.1 diguanylate cyclase response regulator [Paracoccus sp. (in: a-proteobacteria)]
MTARIIVADGTATTRIMMKVRLGSACHGVLTAASSAQLLQHLREGKPDLVLLASGFPDCALVDLCGLIHVEYPEVTILAIADAQVRIEALRAGAAAVLDPAADEQILLARIRGLLRDAEDVAEQVGAMREAAAPFRHAREDRVTLVADNPGRALRWRHGLQSRLHCQFRINNPEEALSLAVTGEGADLYLIAADIEGRGDGLRLLSELRSRHGSRHAAFIVATLPERSELSAIALDLGAGEVLPMDLGSGSNPEMAALAVEGQLHRKRDADRRRAETQRNMVWAMTDPLTGLHNRRFALPRLAAMAGDAIRQRRPFAVLALDLDRFKSINDRFGHPAGDAVLRDVAARIAASVPEAGMTARLGGEEFMIVLPETDEAGACDMAETIRRRIEADGIVLPQLSGGGRVRVTVSVGAAVAHPPTVDMRAETLAELSMERADRALIVAKSLGRNRVMLAQSERAA